MKKIHTSIGKAAGFIAFILLLCFSGVNILFAQCSTAAGPSYTNSCTSDYYTAVSATGSTGVVSTIAVTGTSCTGTYFDRFTTQGITAPGGAAVSINVTRSSVTYHAWLSLYVDWNNNGIYEATELVGSVLNFTGSISAVYNFTVPAAGVVTGTNLRMRLMLSELSAGAPCTANWGETDDFYMNVGCNTPTISVTPPSSIMCSGGMGVVLTASGAGTGGAYSWSPSAGVSSPTGDVVTAMPATTTVYTVTGTTSAGCAATSTATVTVNPAPGPVTGPSSVCENATIALSNAITGGTWTSSNSGYASVDPASGIVTGNAAGSAVIFYSTGSGCTQALPVTVNAAPGPISGAGGVCTGLTIMLSDPTPGGVWSSDNMPVATVAVTGVVSGVSSGAANISYTFGVCSVSVPITVNTVLPITGPTSVCGGVSISLTDATPGGTWVSAWTPAATVSSTGVVTGVASGSATIDYTVGACTVSLYVLVGGQVGTIVGPSSLCSGTTITLTNVYPGIWGSSSPGVADISISGVVTGVQQGTANIIYSSGTCSISFPVTVIAGDAGTVRGRDSICPGAGHVDSLLNNVVGGTWSCTNAAIATVDGSGIVTAFMPGTDTIKYAITTSCGTFSTQYVVHVRNWGRCVTAVGGLSTASDMVLKVFPNPNNGTFTINLLSDADEQAQVVVTNITGARVSELTTTTNQATEIRLNAPPGMYLLSVRTLSGSYVAKVTVY
jgi:uncharacterized protein YjdB